jgi:hypothetical protein
LGASLDEQTVLISQSGLPNVAPTFTGELGAVSPNVEWLESSPTENGVTVGGTGGGTAFIGAPATSFIQFTPAGTISSINGGVTQTGTPNVPPSQVTGIAVIRAA